MWIRGTRCYGHLVITAALFCPGETLKHFLTGKPRYMATPSIMPTATCQEPKLYKTLSFELIYTATQTSCVHLSIVNILFFDPNFNSVKLYLHSGVKEKSYLEVQL